MKKYIEPSFRLVEVESVGLLCNSPRWEEIPIENGETPSGMDHSSDNEPSLMFK